MKPLQMISGMKLILPLSALLATRNVMIIQYCVDLETVEWPFNFILDATIGTSSNLTYLEISSIYLRLTDHSNTIIQ